jgi:hypothetical protein
VKADPAVRADGRCLVCGKLRHPKRAHKYAGPAAEADPFCSSACAHAYWGTTFRSTRGGK